MRIIVLNDGETWTTAKGCLLLDISDEIGEEDYDWYIKEMTGHYHKHLDWENTASSEVIARF